MELKNQEITSLKNVASLFVRESTIHGMSQMGNGKLYPGRRLLWLLLVLMATCGLIVILYLDLKAYYVRPTIVKENIRPANQEDIPSITVCPLKAFEGQVSNLSQVPTFDQAIMQHLKYVDSYVAASALSRIHTKTQGYRPTNISTWFRDRASGQSLVNWTVSSKVLKPIACPRFQGMQVASLPCCDDILEKVLTEVGSCYTINVTKVFKYRYQSAKNRRLVAIFSLHLEPDFQTFPVSGIQVIVHNQNEPPLPTLRGDFVDLDTITTIKVEKTQRTSLSYPYKSFGTASCLPETSTKFTDPIHRYRRQDYSYTVETCEMECLVNYTVNACGCRHPWYPGMEELCSIMEIYSCIINIRNHYSTENDSNCNCPHVCSTTTFTTTITTNTMKTPNFNLPQEENNHGVDFEKNCMREMLNEWDPHESLVILDVVLPKTVRDTIQVPSENLLDILSSFGGLVGLFLGLSLLSLVEVVEFLFLLVANLAKNRKPKVKTTNLTCNGEECGTRNTESVIVRDPVYF
ncbi:acid-sensing ion channel 5-like [Gigantopelta aegis]|uniref:acid-sensing ion channel 5-like n=1 Tax=Gigantopelta aegis TaxID=1735272 RepID=UPI001B888178|nr:acid-sensing ion channel 5-like [Gigantopelta aegis]